MKLNKLKMGSKAKITAVGGEGARRRRLLDLGLTPKTEIMVRKVAPLGDPIEVYLRGYELTLRKEDAAVIEVNEVAECSAGETATFGKSADASGPAGSGCSGQCSSCLLASLAKEEGDCK